jgi:hypothetical protein
MLKKIVIMASVAVAAMMAMGNAGELTDKTATRIYLAPDIDEVSSVAELSVAEKKVMGRVKGKASYKRMLEKEALFEAFTQARTAGASFDVLVAPTYYYEASGYDLTVTVVGYPARYKNFRTASKPATKSSAPAVTETPSTNSSEE